jgi:hypothetical protein
LGSYGRRRAGHNGLNFTTKLTKDTKSRFKVKGRAQREAPVFSFVFFLVSWVSLVVK